MSKSGVRRTVINPCGSTNAEMRRIDSVRPGASTTFVAAPAISAAYTVKKVWVS